MDIVDQIIDGTLCLNMGYVAQIKRIEGETTRAKLLANALRVVAHVYD